MNSFLTRFLSTLPTLPAHWASAIGVCALWLAAFVCVSLQAQTPNNWRTFVDKASARVLLGDTTGALEAYNKIVTISGDSADAYMARALFLSSIRRFPDALRDFSIALAKDSNNVRYYLARGLTKMDMKRYQEAAVDFSLCAAIKPEYSEAYFYRALAATKLGDHESAIMDFDEVVRLSPDNVDALFQRGKSQIALRQFDDAKTTFEAAIRQDPTFAESYMLRASLLIDKGDKKSAYTDLQQAVKLGYKPALEMIRIHCAEFATAKDLDNLQTFVMQEVSVEAERDVTIRAAQEVQLVAQKAKTMSKMLGDRASGRMWRNAQFLGGTAGGELFQYNNRPAIVGNGALQSTSLQTVEAQRPSKTNLDDLIFLVRERVLLTNNPTAVKLIGEVMNRRANLAQFLQTETRENASEVRAEIQEISALLQRIAEVLNAPRN